MPIEDKIRQNTPLAPLTSFKIGGPAKFFIEARTKNELVEAIAWAKRRREPVIMLAGGSKVLISDQGIAGLVIKFSDHSLRARGNEMSCGAGLNLARAVKAATANNLSGLEWAAGIPGTVGGAVYGNAGAFGQATADLVKTIEVYDATGDKFIDFNRPAGRFAYRDSIFKRKKNLVIIKIIFSLSAGRAENIKKAVAANLRYRTRTQPAGFNVGSIFKNLTLAEVACANQALVKLAQAEGIVKEDKIAASWLIDRLGLKGKTIGGALVSAKHSGFIINNNQATAADVIMLISLIKQRARDSYGLQLQEEIQYLGF